MIVKTRQQGAGTAVVTNNGVGPARGLLRRHVPDGKFWHSRTAPPDELHQLVEHFWSVRWERLGLAPYQQETLPHPNVHVVFAREGARITGPYSSRFIRVLEGCDGVFGIKFKAGGFFPFLRKPVAGLADRSVDLHEVFGEDARRFEAQLLARDSDKEKIEVAIRFLRAYWPVLEPNVARNVELAMAIVGAIINDRAITRVEQLVATHTMPKRSLQRLFHQYVGVSPKWVINRYRLHDAVELLAQGKPVDWADVAQRLGYFDQAHFIRDFKKLVGRSPAEYARDEAPAG